jgi:2',3'-cyclic-nucleotide 2'-phosphodiesterase (5'-nucleotidase family)
MNLKKYNSHVVIVLAIVLGISSCKPPISKITAKYKTISIVDSSVIYDPLLESVVKPYRAKVDSVMNELIAYNELTLKKHRNESLLGNWMTDAIQWYCDSVMPDTVDFALMNYGGIRVKEMPKGDLRLKHFFELMPFENKLAIVVVDSQTLIKALNKFASNGTWPCSENLNYQIDNHKIKHWHVQKKNPNRHKFYIAATDYVINGGDKSSMFTNQEKRFFTITYRDILINYAKFQKKLIANKTNRIQVQNTSQDE